MTGYNVWGPAIWNLFHTLAEKIKPEKFNKVKFALYNQIQIIAYNLPCPICSSGAKVYFNVINKFMVNQVKEKEDFKNFIYLFHNYVNKKKSKPLFNRINLDEQYKKKKLPDVINTFSNCYESKGVFTEMHSSMNRKFILKNFLKFIKNFNDCFISN